VASRSRWWASTRGSSTPRRRCRPWSRRWPGTASTTPWAPTRTWWSGSSTPSTAGPPRCWWTRGATPSPGSAASPSWGHSRRGSRRPWTTGGRAGCWPRGRPSSSARRCGTPGRSPSRGRCSPSAEAGWPSPTRGTTGFCCSTGGTAHRMVGSGLEGFADGAPDTASFSSHRGSPSARCALRRGHREPRRPPGGPPHRPRPDPRRDGERPAAPSSPRPTRAPPHSGARGTWPSSATPCGSPWPERTSSGSSTRGPARWPRARATDGRGSRTGRSPTPPSPSRPASPPTGRCSTSRTARAARSAAWIPARAR
jgi:hypothetical protein